ncbi:MAG: hypothetical protein ACTSYA_07145 [Candidatus Kariarchaeaceae archaeon]
MAENLTDVIIKVPQMAIIVLIVGVLLYRRQKNKVRGYTWLIVIFSFAFLQGLTEVIVYFLKESNDFWYRFDWFEYIPYGLALMSFYIFTELFNNDLPPLKRLIPMSSLLASVYAIYLYSELYLDISKEPNETAYSFLFDIFQLIVFLYAFYAYYQVHLTITYTEIKRISITVLTVIGVLSVISLSEIMEHFFHYDFYAAIPMAVCFLVIAIVYLIYPMYVFLLPIEIHQIFVTHKDGRGLFSVKCSEESQFDELDTLLISGAASAISNFVHEVVGTASPLRSIILDDRVLIIEEHGPISAMMIVSRPSYLLRRALTQFATDFHTRWASELVNFDGLLNRFYSAEELVVQCFPFLQTSDLFSIKFETEPAQKKL